MEEAQNGLRRRRFCLGNIVLMKQKSLSTIVLFDKLNVDIMKVLK